MKKAQHLPDLVAHVGSKQSVQRVIHFIGDDQQRFDELVKIFLGDNADFARRAAWPISYIATDRPALVKKWLPKVLKVLEQPDLHPAMYRNLFRFLQFYPVPEKYAAAILNASFRFMQSPKHPVAIRAFAMMVVMNVASMHPELHGEIEIVVRQLMTEKSPAIRSRGRRILDQLSKERLNR